MPIATTARRAPGVLAPDLPGLRALGHPPWRTGCGRRVLVGRQDRSRQLNAAARPVRKATGPSSTPWGRGPLRVRGTARDAFYPGVSYNRLIPWQPWRRG